MIYDIKNDIINIIITYHKFSNIAYAVPFKSKQKGNSQKLHQFTTRE